MDHKEFKEKFNYPIEEVDQLLKLFKSRRSRKERIWRMLDAYDSGEFWDTIRHRLPKHQIIPDTNHVFYVKDNIVNSTYAAPYIADVLPVDPGDQEEGRTINKFLEYEYNRHNLGEKQLKIGTRTALLNCGFLQIGWDSKASFKVGDHVNKGEIEVIPRDPMAVLLDPNFDEFQDGRALFILTEDSYESIVAKYPDAAIRAARTEVEALFEDACHRAFVPRFRVDEVAGTNRWSLVLRRPEVRAIRWAVEVDWRGTESPVNVSSVDADPSGVAIRRGSVPWPPQTSKVRIGYEYGLSRPPDDLLRAIVTAIRMRLNTPKSAVPDRAVSFTQVEGGTVQLATPGVYGWITGVPEVDEALKRHRWKDAGIA